jgi:prepilin-type N-terminal cleavage/methylation domain-containing protein/prepilin-type processing-associated H-X9-DG protein
MFYRQTAMAGVFRLHPSRRRVGFTLLELLIVVAIIGVLAAMLLPALARSKARAQAIFCMNDRKQLALAWTMYSGDNNDRLVYNLGGDANRQSLAPRDQPNWVNNIMDWDTSPDNTNTAFVSTSLLGAYASFAASIYKCPADKALSKEQKDAGWTARVRSVSMNAMIGDPGQLLQGGANVNNPNYLQFLKESDIQNPSTIFVFLDEHPDSINDGYFLNTNGAAGYSNPEWVDLPASYHNGGGSFSFADGHTEIHHWLCDSTKRPSLPEAAPLPMEIHSTPAQERADFDWVLRRTSVLPDSATKPNKTW